jgi:hypothetical protein
VLGISSSSSVFVCRVMRRLFLFCATGRGTLSTPSPDFLRDRVVPGSKAADFTGDDALEAGREPWSPTKKGQVGVLL